MSILDQMTRNASERKADASAALTPVGLETVKPGAFVSTPVEERRSWLAAITEAREHTQRALAVLTAAERNLNTGLGHTLEADYFGIAQEVFPDAIVIDEEGEMPVDEFKEKFVAMQQAAQAAIFTGGAKTPETVKNEWACPDHGFDHIITRKGRTREFRACTACGQYEGKVTT